MGSLNASVNATAGGSGERTPILLGMLSAGTARERERERTLPKVTVLGDEAGGTESDEEEEAIIQAQLAEEEEEAARAGQVREEEEAEVGEQTPLLGLNWKGKKALVPGGVVGATKRTVARWVEQAKVRANDVSVTREDVQDTARAAVEAIPAVVLGCVCGLPSFVGSR